MTGETVAGASSSFRDAPAFDHLAIGTDRFDEVLKLLVDDFGMTVSRIGTHFSTGGRLMMLRGAHGGMIELVESAEPGAGLMHIAYRVEDVGLAVDSLVESGLTSLRPPHRLEAAKAETALLEHPSGLQVQVIKYSDDSPDVQGSHRSRVEEVT